MKIRSSIESLIPYESQQVNVPTILNANETENYLFPNGFNFDIQFEKYPNSNGDALREALAKKWGIMKQNIIIGNGSTELLELSVKTFTEPNDRILSFDPSFSMYDIYAKIHGCELVKVKADANGRQDINRLLDCTNEESPSLIFLCNPNNPTGYMNTKEDIVRLLNQTDALVIVDEAYMDFAFEKESVIDLINEYPNLLVARTFSKAYGLASIRLGYMLGNTQLIQSLLKVKLPYSVNQMSLMLGIEALKRETQVTRFLNTVVKEREILFKALDQLPLDIYPSNANFIYVKTLKPISKALLSKGILIRQFDEKTYRITVGNKQQNQALIKAMKEIIYENSDNSKKNKRD